jgi:very-short-patch-repair endonuclease
MKQIDGLQFRRQYRIDAYFADFACPAIRLVIELDGESHNDAAAYDARRTRFLESRDWHVVRFTNRAVREQLTATVEAIQQEISFLLRRKGGARAR